MPKNIVICCDGTDNKLTINRNTNVVHLYGCLEKNENQITYYHPGVGTIAPKGIKSAIYRRWYKLVDQMSGGTLENHVINAYLFLMENYQNEDKIYLFGFSRGAYTVRMLSGLIEMFGLLHQGNAAHLKYAFEIYATGDKIFQTANAYRSRFSRKVDIHFIGIWDTVVAMGGLIHFYKSFPYSRSLGIAKTVRHAVAIDERRKHFYYYEVSDAHKDCEEVFFAGVHSDVGGSYPEEGLSKIALEWMLGEASAKGLILNKTKVNYYVIGKGKRYQKPNYEIDIHDSLTLVHKFSDLFPRLRYNPHSWFGDIEFDWRRWPKRAIKNDAKIHETVFQKIETNKYKPGNIDLQNQKYIKVSSKPIVYN